MNVGLLLVALVAVPIGGYLLVTGGRDLRAAHTIRQHDPVPVWSLHQHTGPVDVEGTARVDERTVTAPLTGKTCLAYEYEVEEYRSNNDNGSWKTLDSGMGGVDFFIEDDSGRVRVDPDGSDMHLETHTITVDPGEELPDSLAKYVATTDEVDAQDGTINLFITELKTGNRQRFTERRLDIGSEVYAFGQVSRDTSGDREWGSSQVDAILHAGNATPVFVISDTDESGTVRRLLLAGLPRVAGGLLAVFVVVVFVAGTLFL
ncbi:E3 ubiquitin ligase family protein [Natrialbaceae archaeon A-CW2]|uniref:E3 ubiquitin ligase family protein n=1 Tax=Natronosalvus amylolyticus TaxID=2961994 RepID=UPI0020CA02F2|nr:E3 ubiquitin ligase family protein [Natronosalvus amylolyticus]